MKSTSVAGVVAVVAIVAGLAYGMWRMSVARGEVGLDTRYQAQANVVETSLFKMRSSIMNIHTCTKEWADKFIAVVAQQAAGRKGGVEAGSFGVNVSRESEALGIPSDMYMRLANAIEGQLADFTRQQDTLTDIWREHTAYCKDPWHNVFGLAYAQKVKPKPEMITSDGVKEAVATKRIKEDLL